MTEPAKENISKPPPNEGAEETEPDITVKCVTVGYPLSLIEQRRPSFALSEHINPVLFL